MLRLAAFVLAGSLVLAACSAGDESTDASNDSIVLPAKVSATTVADAVPSTTRPAATDAAPSTSVGGPLVAPIELDPCLVGTWSVSVETIGLLVAAAVLPVPDLSLARGGFTVVLNPDGAAAGDADFTAAFSFGETSGEADVAWTGSGTWSTFDGSVTLSLDEQQGGLTEVRLGGAAQPDSALEVNLPLSGGRYTCTDTGLEVTGTTGDTTIPLILER